MTITTSRGKKFDVEWAWGPVGAGGKLLIQYEDDRPLAEIAEDFDGLAFLRREDEDEGDREFTGYSELTGIMRSDGKVTLTLERGDGA